MSRKREGGRGCQGRGERGGVKEEGEGGVGVKEEGGREGGLSRKRVSRKREGGCQGRGEGGGV